MAGPARMARRPGRPRIANFNSDLLVVSFKVESWHPPPPVTRTSNVNLKFKFKFSVSRSQHHEGDSATGRPRLR